MRLKGLLALKKRRFVAQGRIIKEGFYSPFAAL